MKAIAIVLWVLAWGFSGLIPASWFAARDRRLDAALAELTAGVIGAGGLAWAGAVMW